MSIKWRHPFDFDMALQAPVFYMMRRGIRVDLEKKAELSAIMHSQWDHWQAQLNKVAGFHLNVQSPKQMKAWLYGDLALPKRTKNKRLTVDEDALRSLMAMAEDKLKTGPQSQQTKWLRALVGIKLVLQIRAVRKALSSYIDIEPDADGRMRTLIRVGGTETFRFSHSKTLWDTGCNLATIPRKLREMFIPDDGYEIAEFDLNRGESWVYTFLSLDPELMRIHTTGGDFHSETAAAVQTAFGDASKRLSVEEISALAKKGDQYGYKLRYLGKRVNHASAYRMGPFRGAEVVNSEADDTGITVTPSQMKEAQKLWREKYFGIKGWWDGIDRDLEEKRTLITPYGRRRIFYGWMSDHLKKEATAYVPQSTSVDYLNRGMLRVFNDLVLKGAYGLELLHQNHDSILVQYPAKYRDEVIPEIITRLEAEPVIINGHEVTIPVEGSYGNNWRDLTEWKG